MCIKMSYYKVILVTLVLYSLTFGVESKLPQLSPFFFLCNYHGDTQNYGLDSGEVVVSVEIEGNPSHYFPGEFYHVTISSSQVFDNFLMTGLYTTPTTTKHNEAGVVLDRHPTPRFATGKNLMCSIVHSRMSRSPLRKVNFVWMAPPTGTGCVSFLATATYNKQVLFKDTTVLQLCEYGDEIVAPEQPVLAEIHSNTVLMRDDFETEHDDFSPDIWEKTDGGYIGDTCGSVVHGKAAIFCDSVGERHLVTVPLNLTSARVLQFTIGGGGCRERILPDPEVVISFGINSCTYWIEIERIKSPMTNTPEVHIVSLPPLAKQENICLMFGQPLLPPGQPKPPQKQTQETANTPSKPEPLSPKKTQTIAPPPPPEKTKTVTPAPPLPRMTKTEPTLTTTPSETTTVPTNIPVTSTSSVKSPYVDTNQTFDSSMNATSLNLSISNEFETNPIPNSTEPVTQTTKIMTYPMKEDKVETTKTTIKSDADTGYFMKNNEAQPSFHKNGIDVIGGGTIDSQAPDFFPNLNDAPYHDDSQSFQASYHGCWAIDNIVVVNTADPPHSMLEDFDPVDPGNWIFFPGAHVKSQCHSDGSAFVFDERNQSMTFAVTRDLDLSIADIKEDALFFDDFDSTNLRVNHTGGQRGDVCGIVHDGNSLIMDGDKRRQICTERSQLKETSAVHFYFQFGQGSCHSNEKSPQVLIFLEDMHEQTFVLKTLQFHDYQTPQLVLFSLADSKRDIPYDNPMRLCLLQKSHGGSGLDTWALDSLALLPLLPRNSLHDKDKVLQASLNLQCEQDFGEANAADDTVINFEYSTDHGDNWHLLYAGKTDHSLKSQYPTKDIRGWKRVTLPVPFVAQSPSVRLRVIQHGASSNAWALDDVFIGECSKWCNGHGLCTKDGCKCDFGYEGDTCEIPTVPAPSNFHEAFEDPNVVGGSPMLDVSGAVIGYHCSVLASGKALVFNQAGTRSITTAEVDTTDISAIKFTLRIGSQSETSSCPPPSKYMPGIILESSCNGGITWSHIKTFSSSSYRQPVSFSIPLKHNSKGKLCQFRWRQPTNAKKNVDVWAIDDIILAEKDLNSLAVEMMDMPDFGDRLTTNHGKLTDSFCERMRSAVFSSPDKNGELRSLMTSAMKVGPGYIAQFDLVMGCGLPFSKDINNQIYFLFSSNHGINWQLVQPACLPPHICKEYSTGSIYHPTSFGQWKTVTIALPEDTWGQETRFRWTQPSWEDSDVWAISRMYIGPACPHYCHGHGTCHKGVCRCNKGFAGESCEDSYQMDSSLHGNFGPRYDPTKDFKITGGKVLRSGEGCGTLLAGRSLYFSEDGVRELVTKEMNTKSADFIQFYIRIGGEEKESNCHGADKREESVLLQYSNNSGIEWHLIKELHHLEYQKPQFVHLEIPDAAKTPHTMFRWWQPSNSGEGQDQWAIDEILIGNYKNYKTIADNFDDNLDVMASDQWRLITDGVSGKFCGSFDPSLVLSNQINDKLVITNDMKLNAGDIIQFEINVDCGKVFRWDHPVIFQYSHDQGKTWKLVVEPCYLDQDCEGRLTEGSIYYTGTHGKWTLVVIPVTDTIAMHPVIFKWWQQGGVDHSYSLDNVYIGPPCKDNCNRRGLCVKGNCQCYENAEQNLKKDDCSLLDPAPTFLLDRFDNSNMPSMLWNRILSGHLGRGCGIVQTGNSLYFGGAGTREALTQPLDTRHKRILEFTLKLGDESNSFTCLRPRHRNEGIIADFSTDNEITWQTLRVIEPSFENSTAQTVVVELPPEAKAKETIFRFWQPLGLGGMPRAEWAIDNVLIGVNESSKHGFEDKFVGMMPNPDNWFLADAAVQRPTCYSKGNALEFSGKKGQRIAETWDYNVNPSTFLQFELAMGCGSLPSSLYDIKLEYSTDLGHSWRPVVDECIPPNFECAGYHFSSNYVSDQYSNWTRITVTLPDGAISPATRFRWIQPNKNSKGTIWSIDNVFVGDNCPWLCSGHGVCHAGKCLCDEGFVGQYCVPEKPLIMQLKDDFNTPDMNPTIWREVVGGDNSKMCGSAVSGRSMTFTKVGPRLAVTQDMDSSMLNNMEFYFAYGCGDHIVHWPREHSVLLQYSTSGGIHWKLIKEIHFSNSEIKFYSLPLPMGAKHNATRFRFWQPRHGGEKKSVWAVDNLFIGTMAMRPGTLYDDFDLGEPDEMSWLFINNGEIDEYCSKQTRHDSRNSGISSLVFRRHGGGEVSVETTDLELGPMAVLQFDINVGCGAEPSAKYPVRLEYSTDGGLSWSLVGPNCGQLFGGRCFESGVPMTVYYAGESVYWRRIIMPLNHIQVCGSVRFRWYQGKIPDSDFAPEWAIDNVYIGMACLEHCNGHGSCIGMSCNCDEGYDGQTCVAYKQNPTYLKDDFDGWGDTDGKASDKYKGLLQPKFSDKKKTIDESKWELWTGGRIVGNHPCGPVFENDFFLHDKEGQRTLTTVPLDLSKAHSVQFHLKRGCGTKVASSQPLYLQHSGNGGMTWTTMEQFHFNDKTNKDTYITIHLPAGARTNSTQIRWWLPSSDGTYSVNWAIDQVFIGGDMDGQIMLQDDPGGPSDASWLEHPGSVKERACGSEKPVLHFKNTLKERYASSGDVISEEHGIIQFTLSMACGEKNEPRLSCFFLELQYSINLGKTWHRLRSSCPQSRVSCANPYASSIFYSDEFSQWKRVTVKIPKEAWSSQTRFRVYQAAGANPGESWAIKDLYIGSTCPNYCSNHGQCRHDACLCDDGWNGMVCSISTEPLPKLLVEDFNTGINFPDQISIVGGNVVLPCRPLSGGKVLHMHHKCSRLIETTDLDLTSGGYIQFYFMYGCFSLPVSRDEGVLLHYSVDAGITWQMFTEMNYNMYRTPVLISLKLPEAAKQNGVRFRLQQMEHSGEDKSDWLIDGFRIQGDGVNPEHLSPDWSKPFDFYGATVVDSMTRGDYCGKTDVAFGNTPSFEPSTLATREIDINDGDILQFSINVGCGQPWNSFVMPVNLQFSTDQGVTWFNLPVACLNGASCSTHDSKISSHYHGVHNNWRRFTIPLVGLTMSNGTRFRWQQLPSGDATPHEWGITDVYIGPMCKDACQGNGLCMNHTCVCDDGYGDDNCILQDSTDIQTQLKDSFDHLYHVNQTKFPWVQGGNVQQPCETLAQGPALVMTGPGAREVVTRRLDLRDGKFVQYIASMWSRQKTGDQCSPPPYHMSQSVALQYSTNNGIHWNTLHILSPEQYWPKRRDYIILPPEARKNNTIIRWIQNAKPIMTSPRVHWALEDVFIGGKEINPSQFNQSFDDMKSGDDPNAWEFSPYGSLHSKDDSECLSDGLRGGAMVWEPTEDGRGKQDDKLVTNQMIVQPGYSMQFKLNIGCGRILDVCDAPDTNVRLEYRRNPSSETWLPVKPVCLPGNQNSGLCNPHQHHLASSYSLSQFPDWTRVTILLSEATFSSSTQFRWVLEKSNKTLSWALDDILIGEQCEAMCHGRGDCIQGQCICDDGYFGPSCLPIASNLHKRLFESFEGGIFTSHWQLVTGGAIGFGCGALLPYAYGKSLYFNGCGERQAITAEMDTSYAIKIFFVIQIGCQAQTNDCNIYLGDHKKYRGVLLQYSKNKGADWFLIAQHDPDDFLQPKKVAYDVPRTAKGVGTQFRWWQPQHDGKGFDQWAIDHVEIISGRRHFRRGHKWRRN